MILCSLSNVMLVFAEANKNEKYRMNVKGQNTYCCEFEINTASATLKMNVFPVPHYFSLKK